MPPPVAASLIITITATSRAVWHQVAYSSKVICSSSEGRRRVERGNGTRTKRVWKRLSPHLVWFRLFGAGYRENQLDVFLWSTETNTSDRSFGRGN
uniref:Putative secreted peptide n=1 Tax=Anopheles braziliensis TaxID=58242 RepID=A0A2M3ZMG8_9DIPT